MNDSAILRKTTLLKLCFFFVLILRATNICAVETKIPESYASLDAYNSVSSRLRQELGNKGLQLGSPIFIRIFKQTAELELWVQRETKYTLFKTYRICDFSGFLGPKLREGDKQSPEGFYSVGIKQLNPWSNYHLSFNLGYPNEYDVVHKRNGSALMVHGRCSSAGCFAMTDPRMNEIYTIAACALKSGQGQFPVHIFPFRMTWENLALYRQSKWLFFWENLKEGYDYFLDHNVPPQVSVTDKRYVFFDSVASQATSSKPVVAKLTRLAQLREKSPVLANKK